MSFNLDGLELTEEQIEKLNQNNEGLITQKQLNEKIEGLTNKRDELLAEQKRQKEKRLQIEAEAEEARLKSLEKANNFEELYKSSQQKNKELLEGIEKSKAESNRMKIKDKALELAAAMSDGDRVPLLATFVESRLKIDDGQIKVADESGALTISTFDDLVAEFKSATKYASLVSVTKASGGNGGNPDDISVKKVTDGKKSGAFDKEAHRERIAKRFAQATH